LKSRWPPRAREIFLPPTRQWPPGFDRFTPALIEQYLGGYAEKKLGISLHDLLALGRQNPNDAAESFNMAYLAIRGSGSVNGVSRLHGKVSRHLFESLFPNWPADEVPIGHVTNGVHMPTWDSAAADELWTKACGKDRWLGKSETLEQDIRRVSDDTLWKFRLATSKSLVEYARERLARHYAAAGASSETVEEAKHLFDPNALTLGFARRFATYKRPNLLLHDPERLLRLLSNPQRPVQLIIAGKAHPADQAGQALIQKWIQFIRRPDVRPHAIFLSDYDMHLTERLVQGVDVWLNTPQRPWEACGTSGMKVLVNGGINLSELDGWWAEAYVPELGWALGDGQEHGSDPCLGRGRSRGALRTARTRGDSRVLYPQRERHSHGLDRADARKHGAVDPALLRQPRRVRIHRATLSPGGDRLPGARGQQRRSRQANGGLAAQLGQKWAR
jgi:glycogen phosphorylase